MTKEEFSEYIAPFIKQLKTYEHVAIFDNKLFAIKQKSFIVLVDIIPTGVYGGYLNNGIELIPYYPLWIQMQKLFELYSIVLNTNPIVYDNDIMLDVPEFTDCLSLKAAMGAGRLNLKEDNNILVSQLSGNYLPVNKGDTVKCIVRDMGDNFTLLWEYCIYKKKFKTNFRYITRQVKLS